MREISKYESYEVSGGNLLFAAAKGCFVGGQAGYGVASAGNVLAATATACMLGASAGMVTKSETAQASAGILGAVASNGAYARDREYADYAELVERYSGSSRDRSDANYENEMDRGYGR